VTDFSTEWVLTSVTLLTLGSVFTTFIGERISDLKLGNGTSLLIFTSIISYLPATFGRTVVQAFQDGNYAGLATIIASFLTLVLGIVYVQVSTRNLFCLRFLLLSLFFYIPLKVLIVNCSFHVFHCQMQFIQQLLQCSV
jgi:preprotein translocase subunit SecY